MPHEQAHPAQNVHSGVLLSLSHREAGSHPAFVYDFECLGPDEGDRDSYLHLLVSAEEAENAGRHDRAAGLRRDAAAMLRRKWTETVHNLVTTAGKNDLINQYFKGSGYTAAWYLMLIGSGTIAATDTLASHPGWAEVAAYSGTRPALTFGAPSAGSTMANQITFTLNATATVAGAGVASSASGTSGLLYSASDFATTRTLASGDVLNVTPTLSFS